MKILTVAPGNCRKSAPKHFKGKSILLNFMKFYSIFSLRLSDKTNFFLTWPAFLGIYILGILRKPDHFGGSKKKTKKGEFPNNPGQWLFHVSTQFPFTTNETKLDYFHERGSTEVALWLTERLKFSYNKSLYSEMLETKGESTVNEN